MLLAASTRKAMSSWRRWGNATGGGHAGAVAVEQHLDHHPGVIGRPTPPFLFVADRDRRQIQLVHHVGDEVGQVVRRQPFLQGRWQQQLLVRIVRQVSLAHRHVPSLEAPAIILPPPHRRCFSDGLLGRADGVVI